MRRLLILTLALAALVLPATIARAGVSGPSFYVDGVLYRTVGTPLTCPALARRRTPST